jgi:NAD(P)-dependent dehydrogenase (short-subunit alcohol dehydrogenase family)
MAGRPGQPSDPLRELRGLVTGAGSGIGRAIALALAAAGARVLLVGRSREKLKAAAAAGADPGRLLPHPADLAVDAEVESLASGVQGVLGRLDILVHSAGVFARGRIADTPIAELDRQLATHLRAPYLLTQALLPMLREARGQVVFINSSAVGAARAGLAHYIAAKSAARALADCLRAEENEAGVRVLSVFAGRTATPMQEHVVALEGGTYRPETLLQPEDVAAAVLDALALPRTAELTDLHIRPLAKP